MLTLILGRAGSGKTDFIFSEISENISKGISGNILIVPEQYSHDAERELARLSPDNASLYGEVLSFSRLSNRVFAETGGLADKTLDKGGRALAMSVAIDNVSKHLKIYNFGSKKTEFLQSLISAYDELRSACTQVSEIENASEKADGMFGNKLSDLALIFDSYERIKEKSGLDTGDRLQRLYENLEKSSIGNNGHIYIDGFTDFTAQELEIIDRFMKKGSDITVSLTCDRIDDAIQAFSLPASTARRLMTMAARRKVHCETRLFEDRMKGKPYDLAYLEGALFDYTKPSFSGEVKNVELRVADDIYTECEFAASKALTLVREGYRYRDIAIVSPAWDKYASVFKGIFERFNVPINISDKPDILQKPLMSFVTSALDIMSGNWNYNDVFRYIKTGLTGISGEDSDILENYVLKWNIRGANSWTQTSPWKMHPEGYSETMSDEDAEKLSHINDIRNTVVEPLLFLHNGLKTTTEANRKAELLYDFLEKTELYGKIEEKVRALTEKGKMQLGEEYAQLWDILVNAIVQFAEILGDREIDNEEFSKLFKLVLGQYEVGTIPSTVDCVQVGDMSRNRKRGIKHLIVLGATDSDLPSVSKKNGIFSESERQELRDLGIELPNGDEDNIARELGIIYSSFTLPTESITISYPSTGRKSYIFSRIEKIFGLHEKFIESDIYLTAVEPCFELASSSDDFSENAVAARAYFKSADKWQDALKSVKIASSMSRGRLNRLTAEKLYGKNISVSASRVDKFYSCRFSYFLQYGLKLRPRSEATLDAPETGTFMHYILEGVTREASQKGGFGSVTDEELVNIAKKYTGEYADRKLGGLEDKSGRFRYLYSRLSLDAGRVAQTMADELRDSDFSPMDFELKFSSKDGDLPPIEIKDGDGTTKISGIVDRVDGWVHNDRLYLRVVDYKTGKKSFSLNDVWNGMGMQMLIYLFALCKEGKEKYHRDIEPAGVLYSPSRDAIISAVHDLTDDELEKEKMKAIKRSGLLLDDPEVIEAMEKTGTGSYLPVKFKKDGTLSGDSLATLEQLGILGKHIDMLIAQMGKELREGSIKADPYYRSQMDYACVYCDYFDACHFNGTNGDNFRYLSKLTTPEAWTKLEGEKK